MKKKLDSGAELDMTLANFREGHSLFKAVVRELENVNINIGKVENFKEIFNADVSEELINSVKNVIARILSSESIEAQLWPCMARATYKFNGVEHKIKPEIFDDEEIRGDFLIVAKEVLWFNLSPFFKNLGSLSSDIQKKITSSPG